MSNSYYDKAMIRDEVAHGRHREIVGGMWYEIGTLQFEFMVAQGLEPHHKLLDVGCGSLRGGVHFVRYLEANHYYGIDLNASLLQAGYEHELGPLDLQSKLDRANLREVDNFDTTVFGVAFDYAIALSLFTHLNLNQIRICLEWMADTMAPGGKFCATYFQLPDDQGSCTPVRHPVGGVQTFGDQDPYHYWLEDLRHASSRLPWSVEVSDRFDHPRSQRMAVFTRR